MCLGVPGEIVQIREGEGGLAMGTVRFGAITRECCLACVPEAVLGDYVVVHVGFAISRLDREEAERTLAYLTEMGELRDLEAGSGS